MSKRVLDRLKESNNRCEHCKFYSKEAWCCYRGKEPMSIEYWRRGRSCFEWPNENELSKGKHD